MVVLVMGALSVDSPAFVNHDLMLECLRLPGDRAEDDVLEEMVNLFVLWSLDLDSDGTTWKLERLPRLLRDSGQNVR